MHGDPAANPNRRFAQSTVDALIDLIVGCGLRRQIPVWLDFDTLAHLRITLIPQRWPACRGYAGDMRGTCESTPMWSRIFLICAPSVINAILRICPPHIGRSSGKSQSVEDRQSWLAARNCGLSRKISGIGLSKPPTDRAPVSAWVPRDRAGLERHCPAVEPQARPHSWWLTRPALTQSAKVRPAPWPSRLPDLKHPIDHADMKVHMLIQAGAEPVDESPLRRYAELPHLPWPRAPHRG